MDSATSAGRPPRDVYLRNKYGSILEDPARLRDANDLVITERCDGCREPLRTLGDFYRHAVKHAADGRMIAYLDPAFGMIVSFASIEKWAAMEEYDAMYADADAGRHPEVRNRLRPEGLDTFTNAVRPKCMTCGNAATGRGKHLDESITDHEPVIAWWEEGR